MKYFTEVVKYNAAQCLLCQDIIESKSRHSFVTCSCGNVSVDGGLAYTRRVYKDSMYTWKDISIIEKVEREPFSWEV